MGLIEEIKELEKKSKSMEFERDRFHKLKTDVKTKIDDIMSIINDINILLTGLSISKKLPSSDKKLYPISDKFRAVGDALYKTMVIDDTYQVGSNEIEKELINNDLNSEKPTITKIRQYIRTLKNVDERKDSFNIFLFYNKFKNNVSLEDSGLIAIGKE